jgi:hypothetical protein
MGGEIKILINLKSCSQGEFFFVLKGETFLGNFLGIICTLGTLIKYLIVVFFFQNRADEKRKKEKIRVLE